MPNKFEGYTGHLAEGEVLGETKPEQKEREKEFEGEYINFNQAVDIVKDTDFQPFKDPTNPHEKPFPHDVHATIVDLLSLDNYEQVRFYTAVGSYLDRKHGVDAFFELDLGNGESVRATLDMTQNPHKRDYEADVVFQWPRDGIDRRDPGDRIVWRDKVNEVARDAADVLSATARAEGKTMRSLGEKEIKESFAVSSYVLPYPSVMPGNIFYKLNLIQDELLRFWYFGDFGKFHYNLKQSDKYLVEAKTLFEYKQYLLAHKALLKSDLYFKNLKPILTKAKEHGKDTSEKNVLLAFASEKHIEILTKLRIEVPQVFEWKPEGKKPKNLKLMESLGESIMIRESI